MAKNSKIGKPTPEPLLWHEILDQAFDITYLLKFGGLYGSEEKARRQLRRQCPSATKEDAVEAFQKCYELFKSVDKVTTLFMNSGYTMEMPELVELLKNRCPEFSNKTCRKALDYYLWYFRII